MKSSTVYEEIRQERPFALLERELSVVLLRTADVLHHRLSRALEPFGLSAEQYNALRILQGAGAAGHPTLEIARRLVSRSPNITRLLDKLIEKGLATRARDADDRRQAVVRITPRGRARLKKADRSVDAVLAKLLCAPTVELRTAVAVLDRLRAAVAVPTVQERIGHRGTESRSGTP